MAKPKNKVSTGLKPNFSSSHKSTSMMGLLKQLNFSLVRSLIFDPGHVSAACWLLLVGEIVLNVFIIERINYTEIDWRAYMQEVEGFLNGSLDYRTLKGDTGPCVYPAGFIYIYSALYYVTSHGSNIKLAQYIFGALYIGQLYLTYEIYKKTCKVPPYALVLSAVTSYRIHSIYVLRLFNDPIAVFLFYASINAIIANRWKTASVLYSLAVSVKMNVLLYAPCLLVAFVTNLTLTGTAINLFICALIQLVLGAPFLYGNFWGYISASFDLGRIFEHRWTVNFRFLDRELFENVYFHLALLTMHVLLLLFFLKPIHRYLRSYATLRHVLTEMRTQSNDSQSKKVQIEDEPLTKEQKQFLDNFETQISRGKKKAKIEPQSDTCQVNFSKVTQLLVLPFFVTNFIGIACARSLHYQFYCWYFHSLPYLVFSTTYSKVTALLLLGLVEYCWNVYPSTDSSSVLLHMCHVVILWGVYKNMQFKETSEKTENFNDANNAAKDCNDTQFKNEQKTQKKKHKRT